MSPKLETYEELSVQTARQITAGFNGWRAFLDTSARLYKYSYEDQLMIFAQRPDATACASYELWNQRMRRYVRRGAKGIALIDRSGDVPKLRYVFDVSDTGTRRNSLSPELWALDARSQDAVSDMLAKDYGVRSLVGLHAQLMGVAGQQALAYWNEHRQEITDNIDDSFLAEYDEGTIGVRFRDAAQASIGYMTLTRCGLNAGAHVTDEDFTAMLEFNTPQTAGILAGAVSEISGQLLRQIERTVRTVQRERSDEHERAELQEKRRDSDSRSGTEQDKAAGQVRQDAQGLSEDAPAGNVERDDFSGQPEQPPERDRRDGEGADRAGDGAAGAAQRRGRGDEEARPDGLGAGDEQPEGAGGGAGDQGNDSRLSSSPSETAQMSFFPSESEQIEMIDMAESAIAPAFSFAQNEIDEVLRLGGNADAGRMRVALDFMKQKSIPEIAETLKALWRGGNGLRMGSATLSVWYAGDGIRLSRGKSARFDRTAQVLAWEDAARRIGELLDQGQFASYVELAEAPGWERHDLAQRLFDLEGDLTEAAREQKYLYSIYAMRGGGYPEQTSRMAEMMTNPAFVQSLSAELHAFSEAYRVDRSLLRFRYHRLDELQARLDELVLPMREFDSEWMPDARAERFITDDEINEALSSGSGVSGGKNRIHEYFTQPHTAREKADFLKAEYGIGGRSHALSGASHSDESHDSRGIRLKKQDCPDVQLSWSQVASRIAALIRQDHFLTPEEKEQLAQREEAQRLADAPEDTVDDDEPIDTEAVRQRLAESGIVGGEVVDAEALNNNPFIQQVTELAERIQAERENEEQPAPEAGKTFPESSKRVLPYKVGDTVFLDNTPFVITEVGRFNVQLHDPSLDYPIFRSESIESLARLLALDERNAGLLASEPVKDENSLVTETEAVYPGDQNGLPYDVVVERLRVEEPAHHQPNQPAAENFRITDDHLGEGGAKTKYGYNVAAIRKLKQIETEGRTATPQEQEILSRFVGWGGLPNAFDESKEDWKKEYAELKSLLTPEEYDMARASTLNAHYTSPTVIRAIYDAVESMGFRTGNVLEPSCGVGNFFGLLPESMRGSRLYGVELDSLTGRIARQLYPKANITISGFEKTNRQDFFDLAIGNVPFGSYKLNDRKFNAHNFLIHDYFFAKALDQVRAGGVIAFITSKGTMDKASPDVRRYIAERAELLGAIRLPNNAFKANAGTEVTSDILFLQKRDRPIVQDEPWVHLSQTEDGIPINAYFAGHPEMVLGRMAWDRSMYGNEKETTCEPIEGAELAQQLAEAVGNIRGAYREAELPDLADGEDIRETLPADPNVKNYSYAVVDGQVYFRQDSIMIRPEINQSAQERVKGLVALRDCVHRLMDAQMDDAGDQEIRALQAELNTLYDAFTEKYGLINARANRLAFADDSSYYLLCSLENVNDRGELESKADMFTKRTIRQRGSIDHADTAVEALALSIGERAGVDLPYMAQLTGKPEKELVDDLRGVIFRVPMVSADDGAGVYVTADEYLSGNVRDKLRIARLAAQQDSAFAINVEALEKAQPKDLEASEIDVRLGATWISADIIKQFSRELFGLPFYLDRAVKIHYSPHTAEWRIEGKSAAGVGNVSVNMTYGTDRANGFRILEDTLNLRDVRIYDTVEDADGSTKRVLNQRETTLAQQKQQAIKDAFQDWIWKDPQRRHDLVKKYNELFNSTRSREYDGSHIVFSGMNPEISLREHQRNAIAHVLYGGNTLLAHEVGAGKTYEMAAAAMESKRLGLCHKSMFVVPNHLTEQWASEFLRLYPGANMLVTTKKDFEKANRKKFCARIATGDYDAIIIGHSQFERIPISSERQQRIIQQQIDEITEGIEETKNQNGERFTIKQLEKTRKSLEARLEKLLAEDKKDDVVTFEELGVDRLFVDEAHAYKNLFLNTKMRNVAGLSTSEAQKSSDMFAKCRYMDELTGGKGVIFATGTPVSNSMTELYTMQRYLQYETLREKGLTHFDEWASTFGETTTAIELAPEGTGYRARTRFAKFFNLPELMNLFKEVADVKTSDQLNLPVPEARFETIVAQPSELQQEMVESLSERAAAVHSGAVDPSVDNMLTITSDGRKIGLDQRLMNPLLPDDPGSKLNACVGNVLRIWEKGREQKLTQLIFCDMSTPKGDGTFNVYDDIRAKLIDAGVPESEIAFIHHADTEAKKKELFAKVRSGQVRVLLGSTAKMGAGTNVQRLLVAVHHLDVGWRPADMTQRNGRIIRQGNLNRQVQVYNYVTNGTFDAYLFQTLENKQKFISQIMTSKSPVRACDDVDEAALSYAEIKALCAGDERIKEKMDLDVDVARLKLMKSNYQSNQYRLEDRMMRTFPEEIRTQESYIAGFEEDLRTLEAHPLSTDKEQFVGMELLGKHITDKEKAGKLLLEATKAAPHGTEEMKIGEYRGFSLSLHFDVFKSSVLLTMHGSMTHIAELGQDARGNLIRIENALGGIPARMEKAKAQLDNLHQQMAAAKEELGKPFPQEAELQQKSARLAELDAALNMDNAGKNRRTEKAERPSVLAALRSHPPAADRATRQEREAEVR